MGQKYKIKYWRVPVLQSLKSSLWDRVRRMVSCICKLEDHNVYSHTFQTSVELTTHRSVFYFKHAVFLIVTVLDAINYKVISDCLEPHLLLHMIQLYQVFSRFHCPITVLYVRIHIEVTTLPVSLSILEMQNIRIPFYLK